MRLVCEKHRFQLGPRRNFFPRLLLSHSSPPRSALLCPAPLRICKSKSKSPALSHPCSITHLAVLILRLDMQPNGCIISFQMDDADLVFRALADPSRRLLLDRL